MIERRRNSYCDAVFFVTGFDLLFLSRVDLRIGRTSLVIFIFDLITKLEFGDP